MRKENKTWNVMIPTSKFKPNAPNPLEEFKIIFHLYCIYYFSFFVQVLLLGLEILFLNRGLVED